MSGEIADVDQPVVYDYRPTIDPNDSIFYKMKSRWDAARSRGKTQLPTRDDMLQRSRPAEPPPPDGLGICLSGGGIRAAAYGLGALQSLGRHGHLWGDATNPVRAKYLSAVSGGSYIAGAFTLLATDIECDPQLQSPQPALFEEGSPEESYIRNHLSYLRHGPGGVPSFVWSLLLGITINLFVVALAIQFVARPLGWAYGYFFPALREHAVNISISIPPWVEWSAVALGACALIVGWVAVGLRISEAKARPLFDVSALVLGVACGFALFLVGFPELLVLVRGTIARIGAPPGHVMAPAKSVSQSSSRLAGVAGGGAAAAVATIVIALRTKLTSPAFDDKEAAKFWQKAKAWMAKHRPTVINALALILVPVLLLSTFMLFVDLGAANTLAAPPHGDWWKEFLAWLVPSAALLALWGYSDLNSWSLHSFYRRALCRAFCIQRSTSDTTGMTLAARLPSKDLKSFSQSQSAMIPELLVCATVNLSDYGLTPTGTRAAGYVFSAKKTGSQVVGIIPTDTYEQRIGDRLAQDLTIPAAVSIAGAAVSPEMGRMTRGPFRALMALGNVRLGVWVPNPMRVAEFAPRRKAKLRYSYAPRMHFLIREMFGINHARSRFLYVTDGGHYENLGLVELLRRRCAAIICVDASGEKIDTYSTIYQAIRIAGAELDADLRSFDPTVMGPTQSNPTLVKTVFAKGTFTYHDGTSGELTVIKTGVPANAPPVLLDFHKQHPTFPYDSTADQFYDADRFDAYRLLGAFSMDAALAPDVTHTAAVEAEPPGPVTANGQNPPVGPARAPTDPDGAANGTPATAGIAN